MSNQKQPTIATVLRRPLQAGFTLLELVVVIGLLSILAVGAATMLVDDGEWQRAQETPKRWDAIRKAMLGDGSVDTTGNPNFSGYVVDMGRLPQNIKELMVENIDPTNVIPDPVPNPAPQPTWSDFAMYQKTEPTNCSTDPEDCYWLSGGWRGPYLYTAGSAEYRDGWGNVNIIDPVSDALNFGWQYTTSTPVSGFTPNILDVFVQSLGYGNEAGLGANPNDLSRADFPINASLAMVSENEWLNTSTTLQFNIQLNKPIAIPPAIPPAISPTEISNLYLRIYYFQDDADNTTTPALSHLTSSEFILNNTDKTKVVSISVPAGRGLPMGRYAAVIYCDNPDSFPLKDLKVFDDATGAPCDSNNNSAPFYFYLRPSANTVNVQWNLP